MLVVAPDRRAAQHADIDAAAQFGQHAINPQSGWFSVKRGGITDQAATKKHAIVHQHDAHAGTGRNQGCGQTGRPSSGNQKITVAEAALGARLPGVAPGQAPQTGETSDRWLEPIEPGRHEGLVIKARRQQPRKRLRDRPQVD